MARHNATSSRLGALLAVFVLSAGTAMAQDTSAPALDVPIHCAAGDDCFLQQYPDMDQGPGASDPFCGSATYDGHSGTDIRILSLADLARDVPVTAMADGKVLRGRDGVRDRLVESAADRAAVTGTECGNGLVIDHGGGIEAQYCHLKEGSLAVKPGDTVARGETIGHVGASGMAQFPHIHVTIRRNGEEIDPFTGRALTAGCLKDGGSKPLWSEAALAFFDSADGHILGLGMAGAPPDYARLVVEGPPPPLSAGDEATVGWGWFANLQTGDRVRFVIRAPDGSTFTDTTTDPVDRPKAAFMQFAGRARPPQPGDYSLAVTVLRDGEAVETRETTVTVF